MRRWGTNGLWRYGQTFIILWVSKQNSKILHSFRMPSSFSGTFFSRHHIRYESGSLQLSHSHIWFFLQSTTARIEEINRHLGSVNLLQIDI